MSGWAEIQNGWGEIQTPPSALPDLSGNTGKVLTVNATEDGTEWAAGPAPAAAGNDTEVLFNDGGAIAGNAAFTFDKTTGSAVLTGPTTLGPPATDITVLTARASAGPGTAHIAQFQASDNSPLSHIAHDGKFVGDVTGTASAATAAADGLTSASGTAPLTLTLAAKGLTGSVAEFTGDAGAGGAAGIVPAPAAGDAAKFLRGDKTWAAGAGGGVTNSAGANVIAKSDGTNIVASALTEASAGAIATTAGTALGLTATAPAATTGASQVGKAVTITASPAVASTDTAGAAAGGSVTITAGNAARNASGNADGGSITLVPGAGIGTGGAGLVKLHGSSYGLFGDSIGLHFGFAAGNSLRAAYIGNTGFVVSTQGTASYNWSSTNSSSGAADITVRRKAAANPAWGIAAAAPVAYTHNLAADSRAGTDMNTAGANAIIAPGVGTGDATGSTLTIQTPAAVASGSGAQTLTTRLIAKPTGINIPGLAEYADNAAAVGGGLVTGDLYRTSTGVLMVVLP